MGTRHFTAAIKILAEAEQLDPSNPELISLFQAAKSGQGQEQRRRTIEELQNEIAIAVTRDEVARALAMVNEGLSRLPNDPALLQFKGQLERQTDETRHTALGRRDGTAMPHFARDFAREALQMVQERLRMFPENERLEVLHASIDEHLQHHAREEALLRYLSAASSMRVWPS